MTTTLSLRGLARLMGVSEKAVRNARAAGVFSNASVRRGDDGVLVVIDATTAVGEWEKSGRQLRGSARPAAPAGVLLPPPAEPLATSTDPQPTGDTPAQKEPEPVESQSLVAAQRDAMIERGRKLRLENDVREGMLVEADQAAREAFEFARVLREAILNIPLRLAAELAAESDAARVYSKLDAALRGALESTAAILEASANASVSVEG